MSAATPLARHPASRWAALAALLSLAACGGSGSGGSTVVVPAGTNVADVIVDAGPVGSVNLPFVTVTVCQPGTATCATVDHVLLDTGSTGFRVIASVLPAGFTLPAAMANASDPLYECMAFADGYSWGSIRTADVKVADGTASAIPVQVIGDASVPAGFASAPGVPASCPNGAVAENTVTAFGSNGVLGVGHFKDDCGPACAAAATPFNVYYDCNPAGCTEVNVAQAAQVLNPVYMMASNNNGVVITLPSVGSAGQAAARGSLALGIDTQSNNQVGSRTVLTIPATGQYAGNIGTTYKGTALPYSFVDSGSNGYFFTDSSIAACTTNTGFYCPAARLDLTATATGQNGATATIAFSVANADTLTKNNPTFSALPNVAGSNSLAGSFDWGLPFFYGRSVYVGFEGRTGGGVTGPFIAW